jgi:hypothetical protein
MSPRREPGAGPGLDWRGGRRVGDGCFGIEALVNQLQQRIAPGVGVAMVLKAEQVAQVEVVSTPTSTGFSLKDLIVGPDANAGQVATLADLSRSTRFDDIVDRTQRDLPVEEVAEQFDDGPVRAVSTPKPGPVDNHALVTGR